MHNVGIIVNESKDEHLKITISIIEWIENRECHIMLDSSISSKIGRPQYSTILDDIYKYSDFLIVLGGDGTILGIARDVSKYETPILGINLGHLGFLAEVEIKELFESLEIAFSDNVKIEKRIMLEAAILDNNHFRSFYALNDMVITRGTLSRMITMKIYIDDDYVTTVKGDGLIIATPTGSTAYSLSAGGPIINPNVSVIVLTPICPHSIFNNRSIIISDIETIRVELTQNHSDAYLTIDGQEGYKIEDGQNIIIKKAPFKTNLIKLLNKSFYDVLRTKLTER